MPGQAARMIGMASLLTILAVLLWPPTGLVAVAACIPLCLLLLAGMRPGPRWGAWLALLMIPYLVLAAMNILAGPMGRGPAVGFGVATAIAFVAGVAWTRRLGVNLRG